MRLKNIYLFIMPMIYVPHILKFPMQASSSNLYDGGCQKTTILPGFVLERHQECVDVIGPCGELWGAVGGSAPIYR